MPRVSDHLVKSAIRLVRQSTTVPNTSNTRAFTAEVSDMLHSRFLFLMGRSENLAVLNESQIVGDLVIKRAGLRVARLRQPVHPAGAGRLGLAINLFDQCASDAMAPHIFRHVQILEIAVAIMRPGRTMEQVMREPQQPAVDIAT